MLAGNATLLVGIGLREAAIHRQVVPLHQSDFQTAGHDLLKQLLEQLRFLESSVPILRERGVVRNLLIEPQPGEPAPRQMHAQFLEQFALTSYAVQGTDARRARREDASRERISIRTFQPS